MVAEPMLARRTRVVHRMVRKHKRFTRYMEMRRRPNLGGSPRPNYEVFFRLTLTSMKLTAVPERAASGDELHARSGVCVGFYPFMVHSSDKEGMYEMTWWGS